MHSNIFSIVFGIAALAPLAYASAVNIAVCLDPGGSWGGAKTQGFCVIGASGGRREMLHGSSGLYAVPSQQSNSRLQYSMAGNGVTCHLDEYDKTVYASYWGGSEERPWSSCAGAGKGQAAQNFCAAQGFRNAHPDSFFVQCPGFHMEPN